MENVNFQNNSKYVYFIASSSWYLYNFRMSTIESIKKKTTKKIIIIVGDNKYIDKFSDLTSEIHVINMQLSITKPHNLILILINFYRLIKKHKASIVFNFNPICIFFSSFICQLKWINYVNNISGFGRLDKTYLRNLYRWMHIIISYFSLHTFTQNKEHYEFFKSYHPNSSSKISLLPGSGVDLKKFRPIKIEANKDNFNLIYIGRLMESKGVLLVINAAYKLEHRQDLIFSLCGDIDDAEPECRKRILEAKKDGVINFLGFIDQPEDILPQMDCLLAPSNYGEGTPKIMIESISCGVPCISLDVPGCNEIIKNGGGIFMKKFSTSALCESILDMSNKKDHEYTLLSKNCRKLAEDCYSEEHAIYPYLNFCKNEKF